MKDFYEHEKVSTDVNCNVDKVCNSTRTWAKGCYKELNEEFRLRE